MSGIIQVHVRTYTHTRATRIPSKSLREGRVHYLLLLLILTNLPLECVAPSCRYVGDLQVQDTGYLTRFSANSEYSSNTLSEATQSLSNSLHGDSNG